MNARKSRVACRCWKAGAGGPGSLWAGHGLGQVMECFHLSLHTALFGDGELWCAVGRTGIVGK